MKADLTPRERALSERARAFWADFTTDSPRPKIILGRNLYAESIIQRHSVDAVVDDFSKEAEYLGCPVIRSQDLPSDALVLAVSGGKPLSVRRMLNEMDVENLDYFCVQKWAAPHLRDVVFNEGFVEEFEQNRDEYNWVATQLADDVSRATLVKLVNFRLSGDLDFLEGFEDTQHQQYFEEFLNLQENGEVFVDIGCFDGSTSIEFIKRCPSYRHIYAFEPDPNNLPACRRALEAMRDVTLFSCGAGDVKATHRFSPGGSQSTLAQDGLVEIVVERADDLIPNDVSFIKIDTEGSELPALMGARRIIANCGPKLAVAVYHRPGDFWRIPRFVRSLNNDYQIFVRHYTESIYETVMFFVPR